MKSINKHIRHPVILFRDHSCDVKNDKGKYVFAAKIVENDINKDQEKLKAFLSNFNRLDETGVLSAEDGVYTWIFYSEPGSDVVKFMSTQVVSPFELGTRHQALAHNFRFAVEKIYGGGELLKKDGVIMFNLLSGTYSLPLIRVNFSKEITKAIIDKFLSFFPGAVYDRSEDSYISKVTVVKTEILDLYTKYGYTILLFDNADECAKFTNKFNELDFTLNYAKKKMAETEALIKAGKNVEDNEQIGRAHV